MPGTGEDGVTDLPRATLNNRHIHISLLLKLTQAVEEGVGAQTQTNTVSVVC